MEGRANESVKGHAGFAGRKTQAEDNVFIEFTAAQLRSPVRAPGIVAPSVRGQLRRSIMMGHARR